MILILEEHILKELILENLNTYLSHGTKQDQEVRLLKLLHLGIFILLYESIFKRLIILNNHN